MSNTTGEVGEDVAILLTEASKRIVSHPHINTVCRWAGCGVRNVRLRTWLIGGRRFTSHRAIAEFLRDLRTTGYPEVGCRPKKGDEQMTIR
jgi:hypothetical protein